MKKIILVLFIFTVFSPNIVLGITHSTDPSDYDIFIGTTWSFNYTEEGIENIFYINDTIQVNDGGVLQLNFTDRFGDWGFIQYVTSGGSEYAKMGVSVPFYISVILIGNNFEDAIFHYFNKIDDFSVSGYYVTLDKGVWGDPHLLTGVKQTPDNDGDSYTVAEGDCNDTDNTIYPGSIEICGDGIDQDCDGSDLVCAPDPSDIVSNIKANGLDGPVNISSTENLSITIELSPGGFAGENADWWLVEAAPSGLSHYLPVDNAWASGLTYSHQGPLFNLGKFEVLNISGLPAGSYTFYFGVDMLMNGSLDMGQASYDSITINIQPTEGITIAGNITNLDEAGGYITQDSYLQIVKLEDGKTNGIIDNQGRLVQTSDLAIIDIPSDGPFLFEVSSLDPGQYIIACQLLEPYGISSNATPVLAKTASQVAFFELFPGYKLPLNIDLGDVFISLP